MKTVPHWLFLMEKLMKNIRRPQTMLPLVVVLVAFWAQHGHADTPACYSVDMTNGTVYDPRTKLTWEQGFAPNLSTWDDARTYCSELSLDGTGWRLPTAKELQTLLDETKTMSPFIDSNSFPNTPGAIFWTSSKLAYNSQRAWRVNFQYGSTSTESITEQGRVRCVR